MATVSPIVSQAEILAAVAAGKMTVERAAALLGPTKQAGPLRCKVGAKGGVSLYGVNSRFPVTMYAEQWVRVLDYGDEIRAFIAAQNGTLKRKVVAA